MRMRRNYLYTLLLLSILLGNCNKMPENQEVLVMKDLVIPDPFEWNSTKIITLHLHHVPQTVIRISSEDESELYAKLMGDRGATELEFTLVIPTYIDKIRINEYPVEITSNSVNFNFPLTLKSSAAINFSMSFNGSNSWIKVTNATNLGFTNQYSVSAWVKAGRHQSAKIIQKGDWDGLGLGQDLWEGWQTSVAFSDGTSAVVNWGSGRPVLNQWYHLVGTYDGSTIKLYVDGTLVKSQSVSKSIKANTRFISIGSDAGSQKFFQGVLDEVSIWNIALSSTQVTTAKTTGFTGGENGIKGYWKFNEIIGTVCYDLTPDHYDGANNAAIYCTDVGYGPTLDADGDGVPDSYDDYANDNSRAFNNLIPSSGYSSLGFEDLWPGQGDYDFNDLVLGYRINTITNAQNKIVETKADFVIRAIGGSLRNGFGFQLTGCTIPASAITCTGSNLTEDYISLLSNGLESQQAKPTIIVFDNAFQSSLKSTSIFGMNVQPGEPFHVPDTVKIHLTYPPNTYSLSQLNFTSFNPFLIVNKVRGKEIHLADFPPTSLADPAYFGTSSDFSNPSSNTYYKTRNNLPWALNFPVTFDYPSEKQDIMNAYLKMADWAQSGGTQYMDWYKNLPGYRNSGSIYQQ
jgi:LruC domain-containing protein